MQGAARKIHFDSLFDSLQKKFIPLDRFVQVFAGSLETPVLISTELQRGYRFKAPDVRHFCLLKIARAVSALNAAVHLARGGFTQEVGVLMRTLIECTNDVDFVLPVPGRDAAATQRATIYLQDYFADDDRSDASTYKRAQVKRKTVHRAIGTVLDTAIYGKVDPAKRPAVDTEKLLANVYQNTSSYVHAAYPEAMDMYGGLPGRFHLHGMSGTPKDSENYEVISTYATGVANAIRSVIVHLELYDLIRKDKELCDWYNAQFIENEKGDENADAR